MNSFISLGVSCPCSPFLGPVMCSIDDVCFFYHSVIYETYELCWSFVDLFIGKAVCKVLVAFPDK